MLRESRESCAGAAILVRLAVHAGATAVFEDPYPVRWTGEHAVMVLPEHIDLSNAGQILEELLSVVNRGATVLIVIYGEQEHMNDGANGG